MQEWTTCSATMVSAYLPVAVFLLLSFIRSTCTEITSRDIEVSSAPTQSTQNLGCCPRLSGPPHPIELDPHSLADTAPPDARMGCTGRVGGDSHRSAVNLEMHVRKV